MGLWAAVDIAFSMYSILPMPRVEWSRENMRHAFCFFPLVGAVIGGAVWGWRLLCGALQLGPAVFAAGAVVLPVFLSGGIHMDGFCDTMDALGSHQPPEKRLEILKDSRAGAFAVMGCCLYLVALFGLWWGLYTNGSAIGALCVGYILSRALSALSVVRFPLARPGGLAAQFSEASQRRVVAGALLAYLLLGGGWLLWRAGWMAVAMLAAAGLGFLGYRRMVRRQFGGVTGDLAGWYLQICEAAMAFAAVLTGGMTGWI